MGIILSIHISSKLSKRNLSVFLSCWWILALLPKVHSAHHQLFFSSLAVQTWKQVELIGWSGCMRIFCNQRMNTWLIKKVRATTRLICNIDLLSWRQLQSWSRPQIWIFWGVASGRCPRIMMWTSREPPTCQRIRWVDGNHEHCPKKQSRMP